MIQRFTDTLINNLANLSSYCFSFCSLSIFHRWPSLRHYNSYINDVYTAQVIMIREGKYSEIQTFTYIRLWRWKYQSMFKSILVRKHDMGWYNVSLYILIDYLQNECRSSERCICINLCTHLLDWLDTEVGSEILFINGSWQDWWTSRNVCL